MCSKSYGVITSIGRGPESRGSPAESESLGTLGAGGQNDLCGQVRAVPWAVRPRMALSEQTPFKAASEGCLKLKRHLKETPVSHCARST
jgi:hypothetical protein